jgi:ankyrin repeat protein
MKLTMAGCLLLTLGLAFPAGAQDEESPGQLFDAAIDREDVDAVKELLAAGKSANTPIVNGDVTSTPLVKACWRKNMEIVRLLVEAGADVNTLEKMKVVNVKGEVHWFIKSPLEEVVCGDLEIVRYLIGKGAKVNEKLTHGVTVLNLPAYQGDLPTLEVLIAAGGDVNAVDDIGYTPLKHAVMGRKPESIRMLVAKGAKVNQAPTKVNAGETALHIAIGRGFPDIVKVLLELKANPNAKSEYEGTPLQLAQKGDQDDIVAILKAAGAK